MVQNIETLIISKRENWGAVRCLAEGIMKIEENEE